MRLRYRLAWDHDLCRAVTGRALGAILGFLRRRAHAAAVQGRVVLGDRAGARVHQAGDPLAAAPAPPRPGRCHARHHGFDLHAGLCVPADQRDRLERLCRYVLRPPVAQERLCLTAGGRVRLTLRRPWADGTTHLEFEPLDLLARLAALTPRPRINLILYHGVLGPRAAWRALVVGFEPPLRSGRKAAVHPDPEAVEETRRCLGRGEPPAGGQSSLGRADAAQLRHRRARLSPVWGTPRPDGDHR